MALHPGFKAAAEGIASKEGIPQANANAILASASRKASPSAKKKNPRLVKVGGSKTRGEKIKDTDKDMM